MKTYLYAFYFLSQELILSTTVVHVPPAEPDPDVVVIPSGSQPAPAPPGKVMYKNKKTRKTQATKPPPKKTRKVVNTNTGFPIPIPSGLQSVTPLRLNPDLVELAKTFVFDPKEDDMIEPYRPLDLRFSDGEERDFCLCAGDTLSYETAGGFKVSIEPAEVNIK